MTGRVVHTYEIAEPLGEGGMGTVYRGVDRMLEREVAVKVLRPELTTQPHLLQRFRAEAVTLAGLAHPAIATLYAFLREGDEFFMVMEYVPGETLEDLLKREGALPADAAVELMLGVLDGMAYAHAQGVVHRDLKPANLMIRPDGTVKIMDFGIARALGAARLTRTGFLIGTLEYMAPEQIRGDDVDARADLYALGTVLYEMLSGQVPFSASSEYALMQAQVQQPPPPLRERAPEAPAPLADAVAAALAKAPSDRPASAEAFAENLRAALHERPAAAPAPTAAPAPAAEERPARPPRVSGRARAALGALAAVALLTAAWLAVGPQPRDGAPESPAATSAVAGSLPADEPADGAVDGAAVDETPEVAAGDEPTRLRDARPRQRAEILPLPSPPEAGAGDEPRARTGPSPQRASSGAPARLAALRVVVHPYGDVFIDGVEKAKGRNAHTERLRPGTYRVRVVHPTYGAWEQTVRLGDGGEDVLFNFKAQHTVTVTSDPPHAEILVDGRSTGRYTPARLSLHPGERTIEVRKPGAGAAAPRRLTLTGDLPAPVHFTFEPDRPQP